jgi:hypothetical protein
LLYVLLRIAAAFVPRKQGFAQQETKRGFFGMQLRCE